MKSENASTLFLFHLYLNEVSSHVTSLKLHSSETSAVKKSDKCSLNVIGTSENNGSKLRTFKLSASVNSSDDNIT